MLIGMSGLSEWGDMVESSCVFDAMLIVVEVESDGELDWEVVEPMTVQLIKSVVNEVVLIVSCKEFINGLKEL
jgi:hypothetical protein